MKSPIKSLTKKLKKPKMKSYEAIEERGLELISRGNEISFRLEQFKKYKDVLSPEAEKEQFDLILEKGRIKAQLYLLKWVLEE